jgi:hypothetical protein
MAGALIVGLALALVLLPRADAGATLPAALAELAHIDAAKAVAPDLLFLFLLLPGPSEAGQTSQGEAKQTGERAPGEPSRDTTGHAVELMCVHGILLEQRRIAEARLRLRTVPRDGRPMSTGAGLPERNHSSCVAWVECHAILFAWGMQPSCV